MLLDVLSSPSGYKRRFGHASDHDRFPPVTKAEPRRAGRLADLLRDGADTLAAGVGNVAVRLDVTDDRR